MTHLSTPNASVASAQQQLTRSADAKEDKQVSACQEELEGVTAVLTGSFDATATSKTAETNNVDAAEPLDNPAPIKYHVQSLDESYEVFGVDAIWHNQYAGPKSDFISIRKQYHCDINAMILKVAEHIKQGVYTVISMNATPHMLTVICGCEKLQADLPGDVWDDPFI